MVSKVEVRKVLKKLFKKARVATLDELFEVLETRSRVTVFRRLKEMGYLSSFTHNGRYYTLTELPDFDERGLWFFRNIGFSRAGTLKETTFKLVETSFEGRTHEELKNLLRVRVHNTLLTLVREGRIGRERLRSTFLYVSADAERAAKQLAERQETSRLMAEIFRVATDEEVVEILAEALRAAPQIPEPEVVSGRLMARGLPLEPHHVAQVYEEHHLVPGKKTAHFSSRRSRR